MTFDLLNQLGLSGLDYSYLFIGLACISLILLILVIIQMFQIGSLKKKYKKFMGGKDVKSLEKKLETIIEDNKYIIDLSSENKKNIKEINKEMEFSFNKVVGKRTAERGFLPADIFVGNSVAEWIRAP